MASTLVGHIEECPLTLGKLALMVLTVADHIEECPSMVSTLVGHIEECPLTLGKLVSMVSTKVGCIGWYPLTLPSTLVNEKLASMASTMVGRIEECLCPLTLPSTRVKDVSFLYPLLRSGVYLLCPYLVRVRLLCREFRFARSQ